MFENGRRSGEGTLSYIGGQVESGQWENGVLVTPPASPAADAAPDAGQPAQ
jgi:hypothetical protein